MLLLAVLVVAVAGFAVYRLHGIFASHDVTSTPSDAVKDERSTKTINAFTYCLDKSG
jgi:Mycobacterium membrane protein